MPRRRGEQMKLSFVDLTVQPMCGVQLTKATLTRHAHVLPKQGDHEAAARRAVAQSTPAGKKAAPVIPSSAARTPAPANAPDASSKKRRRRGPKGPPGNAASPE
mmetsp:Transcript_29432/g.90930  ORF Transcript_29432/g.90930 Transcript_29432/m.90930 type:complete len:104 (-) Transcript_29432:22-333(-)